MYYCSWVFQLFLGNLHYLGLPQKPYLLKSKTGSKIFANGM